ncbi:H-NS histone family protein [Profundibacterium mesophilum]|uniref:Histone-like nucleoid-structuring protein H-NS n=1 Tax=Profundibacterium mesophilum KAUST100406-0324 TaxID=1037889 RepID=A0A921TCT8_9RHOB|nr:H-NS histone family protein [Profundibacterium mesophilum]KAF0675312.1 Histone-like nucleoid-structuring protein H-NS [Profundibacterium mesophilum KAUST100406-0324]
MDLERMSQQELEKLRTEVDNAIRTHDARRRAQARKAAETAAKEHGFSLDELMVRDKKPKKSPARYRNPEDPSQTWTGRGRQPGWIKSALENGGSLEDFAI